MSVIHRANLLCAAAGFVLAAGSAQGQETRPTQTAAGSLEEVVVTARRREERLQDVPVAVAAMSGAELKARSVLKLEDVKQIAPGFSVQATAFGSSVPAFVIRGQRQFNPYLSVDASVSVYFAETPLARAHGTNSALFDLASVQVLKGPQGTLFGRNTTGGAVLITPQAPTDEFGGYMKAAVGNYSARNVEGALNIPLGDALKVRFAGQVSKRDGYTHNLLGPDLDNENNASWRLSVAYEPNDIFSNQLVLNGYDADEGATGFRLTAVAPGGLAVTRYPALTAALGDYANLDFHTVANDLGGKPSDGVDVTTGGLSNITKVKIADGVVIRNILGFNRVASHTLSDFDGSGLPVMRSRYDMRSRQWSDELQVQGTALDQRLEYVAGLFYFQEKGDDGQYVTLFGGASRNAAVGHDVVNRNKSVFAQGTYRFPEQNVSVTLGARYSRDSRKIVLASQVENGGTCLIFNQDIGGAPISPCAVPLSASFSRPTYNATIDWKPRQGWLLYAAYRTGYRTGGFNIAATRPGQFVPFLPENVDDIELGSKLDWSAGDVSGRLNVAAFYDSYKDIQRSVGRLLPNNLIQSLTLNAAEATVKGLEADAVVRLTDDLEIRASYAYVHAAYDSFIDPAAGDLSGNRFGFIPKHAATLAGTWILPTSGQYGEFALRADGYYQSSFLSQDNNLNLVTRTLLPAITIKAYAIANARLEWRGMFGSDVDVAAYVRNIADKKYFNQALYLYTNVGFVSSNMAPPRTYGVELNVKF